MAAFVGALAKKAGQKFLEHEKTKIEDKFAASPAGQIAAPKWSEARRASRGSRRKRSSKY